ncbi:general substrate transporter [Exophiala viscosa]|uniref:General substrate transporter n=1 Tax=Exophiala viscosa TaxID=2486360 RepID=A0AAN6DSB8_9EURO|nr:general substrate transporter [Exophiala viscosa]KAI1623337.1 general substrate transporter [Exophiala viscosa]
MSKEEASTTAMAEGNDRHVDTSAHEGFWHHWRSFVYCSIACLGGLQLGIDLGAIAGMQAMPGFLKVFGYPDKTATFGYGIRPTAQTLINSLMSLGAFLAGMSAGPLGKYVSRRWSMALAIVFNAVGVILMMAGTSFGALYAGRFIVGIANGLFDVIPQLYIHESAPAHQRGSLLGMFNVLVSIGLLIGSIADNYTAPILSKASYQIPLGIFLVMPTIMAVALPFMPETPRWLIEHNQPGKARAALTRLRNKQTNPVVIDLELEAIQQAFENEKALVNGVAMLDLFRKTNLRRTLLSWSIMTCLGGSGALMFLVYGTYFFSVAGQTKAFEESIGMTAAGLVATIISMWAITKIGRRTILLVGFLIQAICMLILAVIYHGSTLSVTAGKVLVAFTIIYLFFYNFCIAPYVYLSAGEIPTQRLRGYTLGSAIGIAFFWNWLVTFTAPYFLNPLKLNWGGRYGYVWFGSNIVIILFVFFFLPETKDRTLEEIDEMFENKVPALKFKRYQCVRTTNIALTETAAVASKHADAHHVEAL